MKDNKVKKTKNFANFLFLLKFFIKYGKSFFIFITITCLFTPLITVLDIYVTKYVIEQLDLKSPFLTIVIGVLIILGSMLIINIISNIIEVYLGEKLIVIIRSNINKELFNKINKTDIKHFDDKDFYENYAWSIDQLVNKSHEAARFLWGVISAIVGIGSLIALIATMDWIIIIIAIISVVIGTFLSSKSTKLYYKKNEESATFRRDQNYINRLFYLKNYQFYLKTSNVNDILREKYDNDRDKIVNVANKYRMKLNLICDLEFLINYLFLALVIFYLCFKMTNSSIEAITVSSFVALIAAFSSLKNQLLSFFKLIPNYQNIAFYGKKIKQFFDSKSCIENSDNNINLENVPFKIDIDDVSFSYTDKMVLNNINMHIKPKEKIAIVGENGVGKSTLVNLILRLYDPNDGVIKVNDVNLKDVSINSYRNNIGMAFQQSLSFSISLRDNMKFYNQSITDEEIMNIFKLFGFDKVLKKGNYSLDSYLTKEFDSNGMELSFGEMQLLSICRTYTKKFPLIILDEPSASLDPYTEKNIMDIILNNTNDSTIVLISHRLSNVRYFDRIFLISEGKILESGTHDELMKNNGVYADMFNKQAENYK